MTRGRRGRRGRRAREAETLPLPPTAEGLCPRCGGSSFQVVETGYVHWWSFGELSRAAEGDGWEARPGGCSFDWSECGEQDDTVECRACLQPIACELVWG